MPTKKKKTAGRGQLARTTSAKSVQEPQQEQLTPDFLAVAGIAANLLVPLKDESEAIRSAYRLIALAESEYLQEQQRKQQRADFEKKDKEYRSNLSSDLNRDEKGLIRKDQNGNRPPLPLRDVLVNIFPHDAPIYREKKLKQWIAETEGANTQTFAKWKKAGVPAQAYDAIRLTASTVLRARKEQQTRSAGKTGGTNSGKVRRGEAPKKKAPATRLTATQRRGLRGIEKSWRTG